MIHFLNRLFSWIPLLNRDGSDRAKIIFNVLVGGFAIGMLMVATSYLSRLIENRAIHVHRKLLFQRTLEDNQNMFTNLSKSYIQLKPILANIYGALPKEEDVLFFSDALEKLSIDTGNQMTFQFDTQDPTNDTKFSDVALVHFSAKLNGNYDSFMQFLKGLSRVHYFMSIDQMTIENSEKATEQSHMSVNGTVFIRRKF